MLRLAAVACLLVVWLMTACGERGPRDLPAGESPRPPARAGAPNVLVVVIDTLRADAVAPDDPSKASMPRLSKLAQEFVCATQASSPSSWTLPSLASLLTGVLPSRHGVLDPQQTPTGLGSLATWAGTMRDVLGYRTAARFGGLSPEDLRLLGQHFDQVADGFRLRAGPEPAAAWMRTGGARPWFLLLHTYEAHDPYGEENHPLVDFQPSPQALRALQSLGRRAPPEELVRRAYLDGAQRVTLHSHPSLFELKEAALRYTWDGLPDGAATPLAQELASAYRGGTRWVDGMLAQALDAFEAQGLLENTLVVVTSDHGESFGEHGMLGHGRQLYDELVRVPLVLRGPPPFDRALRLDGSVGLIDLFPTIVEWLGAAVPPGLDGVSFLPGMARGDVERPVVAQVSRGLNQTGGRSQGLLGSVRSRAWKYVATLDLSDGAVREEVYDLRSDPDERIDRAAAGARASAMPFDDEFCRRVESVRDWLWKRAGYLSQSGTGIPVTPRPEPACELRR